MDFNPQWGNAIASIESGGEASPYTSITPNPNGRRALGKYQVMEENLPEWTQAALGRRLNAQEFLADPNAQDAVFQHRFGSYVDKYGNPQDAASAWFTGGPMATGANKRDVLGTTGSSYVDKFNRYMDGPSAIQSAMRGKPSTGSTAMGYADDAPALSAQATIGPGVLVPGIAGRPQTEGTGYDLRSRLLGFAASLSSASDPDQAKVLAAQSQQPLKDTGSYSLGPIDPQTGIGLRIHNKTGQVTAFQAQTPKEDEAVKAFKTSEAKRFSDLNGTIAADAQKSNAALGSLGDLRTVINNPDVPEGPGAETINKLKKIGNTYLGMDFKGVADADTAIALMNKLTQESRALNGGLPGSLSDKDLAFLKAANPSLDKSKDANNRIIDIYAKLHQAAIERDTERQKYLNGNNGLLDEGFNGHMSKYFANKHAADNAAYKAELAAQPAAVAPAAPVTQNTYKSASGKTFNWSYNPH